MISFNIGIPAADESEIIYSFLRPIVIFLLTMQSLRSYFDFIIKLQKRNDHCYTLIYVRIEKNGDEVKVIKFKQLESWIYISTMIDHTHALTSTCLHTYHFLIITINLQNVKRRNDRKMWN